MLQFLIVRWLERKLSVRNFYRVLSAWAFLRATVNTAFKKFRPSAPLPPCLEAAWSRKLNRQRRRDGYLNDLLDCFADRLAAPKWAGHCRINGLERVRQARREGRPVVLVFLHFGPYWLIRTWLRVAGIPAIALVAGKAGVRWTRLRRHLDESIPFSNFPTAFCMDQLRETTEFLAAGGALCVAVDNPNSEGKQIEAPFCDGWTLRMNTGAVRLAIRHQAEVIPVTIFDEGGWRFRIELGRSVPKEFLTADSDWRRANKFLLDEFMPHLQSRPEACRRDFLSCLSNNSAGHPSRKEAGTVCGSRL